MSIRIVRDLDECRCLWTSLYPCEGLFDLWEVRACFARAFDREPYFIVYEKDGEPRGLLPLCRIEEKGSYAFFPGETWLGKTWMEQNRIIAGDETILKAMLEAMPQHVHIRYLTLAPSLSDMGLALDEIGYLYHPAKHDFSYDRYLASFSGKSRKKILGEVNKIKERGIEFRYDESGDINWVFRLNLSNFGDHSYFYDPRFMEGFHRLVGYLKQNNMLRVVSLLVEGTLAAVDIGAIYNNKCTVLAGGTHRDFPGVAKVINLHHMEWACREHLEELDFLCGDFGWKERFRLFPRPLYQIEGKTLRIQSDSFDSERISVHAA